MSRQSITHRNRLEACLSGQILDRPPVALWRHFPVDDQSPERLTAAAASFQHQFDFDILKVTPASSYCLRDWGVQDIWQGDSEGTRNYSAPLIHTPEDWRNLTVLSPERGALGDMLTSLNLLVKEFSPSTPILHTIFSPMSQAKNLAGKNNLIPMLRKYPDALKEGLEIITETTIQFIDKIRKTGIDGIFFAVQHAQYGLLSEAEFEEFCLPYDLRILAAASSLWMNMVHIHGENIMFEQIEQYPVQSLNWHDRHTSPSLSEAQKTFSGIVCGGLRRTETMVTGNPQLVEEEILDAIAQTRGKRLIIGTGCVLPITAPYGNILAAKTTLESTAWRNLVS